MPASGLSTRPALRLPIPPPLPHWHHHLGRRVGVDLHMPMLLVCDHHSRAGPGVDQGSHYCHEVVHLQDPLLDLESSCIIHSVPLL
ncbi:hypothetical protein L1049_021512 [Liquidambar formosana]|uniref:Uncharacterized protein n=1 Tax=Liquidambar formosana TaxID=63359 RepID=A0AAP0N3I9_LIQFO